MDAAEPAVVVGVDGSDDGLRAAAYASREATVAGTRLHIVHAVDDAVLAGEWGVIYDPTILEEGGRHAVEEAVAAVTGLGFPPERIDSEVSLGNAAGVLVHHSEDAHMVVVGRRAVSGLGRIFVGSTSVSVAANAHCPVVMISHDTNPEPTGGHGLIGIGLDGEMASDAPLRWAFREARARGARLRILHIIATPPARLFSSRQLRPEEAARLRDRAESAIAEMVAPLACEYPNVAHDVEIAIGTPVDELVERSAELDLLIVGTQRSGFPGQTLGGLVRGVMAHALCPVGVLRADHACPEYDRN